MCGQTLLGRFELITERSRFFVWERREEKPQGSESSHPQLSAMWQQGKMISKTCRFWEPFLKPQANTMGLLGGLQILVNSQQMASQQCCTALQHMIFAFNHFSLSIHANLLNKPSPSQSTYTCLGYITLMPAFLLSLMNIGGDQTYHLSQCLPHKRHPVCKWCDYCS